MVINKNNFPTDILVSGKWRQGRGYCYSSIYPADQSVNTKIFTASIEDAVEAIETANMVWQENWANRKPHQRAEILYQIANLIIQQHESLAQMQCRDNGKPISETRILVTSAANTFRYFAACLETLEGKITPSRGDYLSMNFYEPLGVIVAITPWNSPLASDAQKIAPALAAGNAVILKPSENTPLCSLALGHIYEKAGVPPGIISILPGKGSIIGQTLINHPFVKKITFTGSTKVGMKIAKYASKKLIPISLELGGKSPNIVFSDANFNHAINGILYGIFSASGQSCIAGSRLFIEDCIYDQFIKQLITATKKIRIGDPILEETQMGPLISKKHRLKIEKYIKLGLQDGGNLLFGGERPIGVKYKKGFFFLPTIIDNLNNSARICQEEIFGPVLVVLPFSNENDLIDQANDSIFGLAAGIWTLNYKRAYRIAQALKCGTIWINTYKQLSISTPFSGWKKSGIGCEKGRLGILGYMQPKSLYWGLNEQPLSWI